MNVIEALEAMEVAPQGNARLETLKKYDSPELRRILTLALDPSITFGIKKLPGPVGPESHYRTEESWYNDFLCLLGHLSERTLTGNNAQKAVGQFLGYCDDLQRKWSERVLKQDLRINLGAKDVNNALGEQVIYLFEVPLATDFRKCKPKDFKGRFEVQAKLDGGRCVAILPACGGRVRLLSRTGKEWFGFESIRKVLQEYNSDLKLDYTLYLDGEVVSYVNGSIDFQAIQKVMHAKDGREVGELRYVIFDAARESEWKNPGLPYSERLEMAEASVRQINSARVTLVPQSGNLTDPDPANLKEQCQKAVEMGYEGLILRRSDCPVENKRGKKLMKVKLFQDAEAPIVGYVEGQGKLQGKLGTLVCTTPDNKNFELGSGFSDRVREELWAQRERLIGQRVCYKYFETTDAGIPRLPIYKGIRHPDDI